jgi:hypothetical protein
MSKIEHPRYSPVTTGLIGALLGLLGCWFLAMLSFVVFGLPAFASYTATILLWVGASLMIPSFFTFFPVASLIALLFCIAYLRHEGARRVITACITAVIILVLLSAAGTILTNTYWLVAYEEAREESGRLFEEQDAIRLSVTRVLEVSAKRIDDALLIQPVLQGDLPGTYRGKVVVGDAVPLYTVTWEVQTPPTGLKAFMKSVPLDELRRAYRKKILENDETVLVESTFSIHYSLELLSSKDPSVLNALPPESPARTSEASTGLKIDLGRF